jgi:hypothetical protein
MGKDYNIFFAEAINPIVPGGKNYLFIYKRLFIYYMGSIEG